MLQVLVDTWTHRPPPTKQSSGFAEMWRLLRDFLIGDRVERVRLAVVDATRTCASAVHRKAKAKAAVGSSSSPTGWLSVVPTPMLLALTSALADRSTKVQRKAVEVLRGLEEDDCVDPKPHNHKRITFGTSTSANASTSTSTSIRNQGGLNFTHKSASQ